MRDGGGNGGNPGDGHGDGHGGGPGGLPGAVRSILSRANVDACIHCGRCTASCPAALPSGLRARAVVRAVQDGDMAALLDRDDIWHCTTCFCCQDRCPKGVLVTQAILWLRAEVARRGRYPAAHATALAELLRGGNVFPLAPEVVAVRSQLSLPKEPPDVGNDAGELAAFQRLAEALGIPRLQPPRRPYPGETGGADTASASGEQGKACPDGGDK
jgi:heterodisulfide reductase subunit C